MRSSVIGGKVYALAMFCFVSVLAGLLVAGLAVPFAQIGGLSARMAANSLQNLPADMETPPAPIRSTVYLADGTVLAQFFDENRIETKLGDIAPIMRAAQLAIEDHRFYEHGALDLKGTLRALLSNSAGPPKKRAKKAAKKAPAKKAAKKAPAKKATAKKAAAKA